MWIGPYLKTVIYFCDQICIFSIITPVYSHMIFRNQYNMLNSCSISNISYAHQSWKQYLLLNICVETMIHNSFINKKLKQTFIWQQSSVKLKSLYNHFWSI